MKEKNNIFIGIDVSKATLDISMRGIHCKIKNNKKAIDEFINSSIASKEIAPTLVCLESTGGYEKLAIQRFANFSIPLHKAHPNRVHSFAKALGHFAKTDKLDAKLLEQYAEFVSKDEKGDVIISKTLSNLAGLKSLENNLKADLHAYKCRLEHAEAERIYIKSHIKFIENQIKVVGAKIDNIIADDDELRQKKKILKSLKGVGEQTANSLLIELSELGHLNKREIASLVGIVPKTYQSGNKHIGGHISGGRFYVRKVLYMAALVAAHWDERMGLFYQKLVSKGKAKKVALIAVMRKMLICLNAMVKNNQIYS